MTDTKQGDVQLRVISPRELALFVTMHRQGLGWTQETLAEISGLTVRTIQRVEKTEASSVDTRRALARAFKIEDMDAFNKPHAFSSTEKIKREADEFQKNHLTLPVSIATSGKQLADLAEEMNMHCFRQPDEVCEDVAECVAYIFDYMREYGDADELYSFSDKVGVHATLNEHLGQLMKAGFSVCYTLRKTNIVGKNWVDKTPMPVSIAYMFVTKKGEEPKLVAVPKALDMGF